MKESSNLDENYLIFFIFLVLLDNLRCNDLLTEHHPWFLERPSQNGKTQAEEGSEISDRPSYPKEQITDSCTYQAYEENIKRNEHVKGRTKNIILMHHKIIVRPRPTLIGSCTTNGLPKVIRLETSNGIKKY